MINGTVSHEIRNPLNSIVAFNVQKEMLYSELQSLLSNDSLTQLEKNKKSIEIFSQLKIGREI